MDQKICVRCGREGHRSHSCPYKLTVRDYLVGTLLAILFFLSGCSTTGPEVVKVPVPVPCQVTEPAQPEYRFAPPYPDVFDGVRDLLGDREVALAYEHALRTALRGCTK
jgi:hypothetical protein